MKDYIYYTPFNLVKKMLKLIEQRDFENVIDICCGSWNLLHAAREVFMCKNIVGVDIDNNVSSLKNSDEEFFLQDGREYSLKLEEREKYQLVLTNPPFGLLDTNDCIMKKELINHAYSAMLNKRYEMEMLVANMLLVKPGGVLFAVLPQTFVVGDSYRKIRCELAKEFFVESIIKLPPGTFKKKDIYTCAIIMKKEQKKLSTTLYKACNEEEWTIQKFKSLSNACIKNGNWWNEHSLTNLKHPIDIYRGNISSAYFIDDGENEIYHCSSIVKQGTWIPCIKRTNISKEKQKLTKKGDVLVNRIGKRAGYWSICQEDEMLVSDCVIVINSPTEMCMEALLKNSNNGKLNVAVKGVTTSYITIADIKQLLCV